MSSYLPAEAVFGVANSEALDVQLAEQALIDEVLFIWKLLIKKVELFKTLHMFTKIVKNIENKLGKESHYYDKLYIKTTIWIADILDEQDLSKEEFSTEKATNIIFSPPFENTNVLLNKPDF